MTTKIRETDKSTMWKSLAGLGVSFYSSELDEQSLWDTDLPQHTIIYLISSKEEEFDDWVYDYLSRESNPTTQLDNSIKK